ncbi:Hypothetical protein TGAM_1856 [Thermococcus gammatolerans EJ3]|uniref:Uncharacterized protein n=1 Tax=Thermococcus gammatolerans (strain DSM 15229 / JCM 11827 / EJ3) TaxID=593117 RepID=C5A1T9_THEGJ|nr:Hypothetical protein TGAM_1856 [Thermococcus gammatolerans EJ3]
MDIKHQIGRWGEIVERPSGNWGWNNNRCLLPYAFSPVQVEKNHRRAEDHERGPDEAQDKAESQLREKRCNQEEAVAWRRKSGSRGDYQCGTS